MKRYAHFATEQSGSVITARKNAKRLSSATLHLNVATIYIMARYLDRECVWLLYIKRGITTKRLLDTDSIKYSESYDIFEEYVNGRWCGRDVYAPVVYKRKYWDNNRWFVLWKRCTLPQRTDKIKDGRIEKWGSVNLSESSNRSIDILQTIGSTSKKGAWDVKIRLLYIVQRHLF